ncbi:MAG TPA: hypothetical protein PLK30_13830 [Blastocatellia bacterium]|nr:hypothetical protein [Blastocatellia bacterium]
MNNMQNSNRIAERKRIGVSSKKEALACRSCDSQHHFIQGIDAQVFDPSLLKVILICKQSAAAGLWVDWYLRLASGERPPSFRLAEKSLADRAGQFCVTKLFFAASHITSELLLSRRQFSCALTEEIFCGWLVVSLAQLCWIAEWALTLWRKLEQR